MGGLNELNESRIVFCDNRDGMVVIVVLCSLILVIRGRLVVCFG